MGERRKRRERKEKGKRQIIDIELEAVEGHSTLMPSSSLGH